MYTAISGQAAIALQLQVIANNLANMTTSGFKAERLEFEHVMNKEQLLPAALGSEGDTPPSVPTDTYVQITGGYTDLSAGPVEITNNPLDAAIDGKGFFVVQTPNGERYTRAGEFTLDANGRLVTMSGFTVQGDGGEIVAQGGPAKIGQHGEVQVGTQTVGRLRVVELDPATLTREPGQLFKVAEGGAVQDVSNPKVVGGAVEASNVNAVRELTEMLQASKLYESLQRTQDSNSKMSQARNLAFGRS